MLAPIKRRAFPKGKTTMKAKKKEDPMKTEKRRPTSLLLPEHLWKAAHVRAIEEDLDFREIVWKALELYLKTPKEKK